MTHLFLSAAIFLSLNTYPTEEHFGKYEQTFNAAQEQLTPLNHMELVKQFFTYISYLGNSEKKADVLSLQKYLSDNFIVKSNHETISQGIEEFQDYIVRMQEKYTSVIYSDFLENPIICGNKAVLHFHVKCLTKSGTHRYLDAIAILTFEKGKISIWEEVFHDVQE